YPPHIFKMDCFFVKFQEDVTFSLFGAGPVQIFIDEIVKEESWWKGNIYFCLNCLAIFWFLFN
ncbi:hypothetical protein ABTN09_20465, partial [Acinetobacter baumannii]